MAPDRAGCPRTPDTSTDRPIPPRVRPGRSSCVYGPRYGRGLTSCLGGCIVRTSSPASHGDGHNQHETIVRLWAVERSNNLVTGETLISETTIVRDEYGIVNVSVITEDPNDLGR